MHLFSGTLRLLIGAVILSFIIYSLSTIRTINVTAFRYENSSKISNAIPKLLSFKGLNENGAEINNPIINSSSLNISPLPMIDAIFDKFADHSIQHYHPEVWKDDYDLKSFSKIAQTFDFLYELYKQPGYTHTERLKVENTLVKLQEKLYPWIATFMYNSKNIQDMSENTVNLAKAANSQEYRVYNLPELFTAGKGIVMSCGHGQVRLAAHSVNGIRNILNSTLPIDIYYGGKDDLTKDDCSYLESIGPNIRTIDIEALFAGSDMAGIDRSATWAIKPFAILASRFREVILMDEDANFLMDPIVLFQEPKYEETGTIFYRDRSLGAANDENHDWLEATLASVNTPERLAELKEDNDYLKRKSSYEMESGVVVMNKEKVLTALLLVCHLNTKSVRNHVSYKKFYGDKETYWIGFALAGQKFNMIKGYSGTIGKLSEVRIKGVIYHHICSMQLLHFTAEKNLPLWFNAGLLQYKAFEDQIYLEANGYALPDSRWECCKKEAYGFESMFCISEQDKVLPLPLEYKRTFDLLVKGAKRMDLIGEKAGLFKIKSSDYSSGMVTERS